MTTHTFPIPFPRAGRINDSALAHIKTVAVDAQRHDTLDAAGAALVLLTLPQLIDELQQRRRIMADMHETSRRAQRLLEA